MLKMCLLTVSDTRLKQEDLSGKKLFDFFSSKGYEIAAWDIVKDERNQITKALIYYADDLSADIVLTSGGTGFSQRDITPEATREVIDKVVPGISEHLRAEGIKQTPRAVLSRGIAGIRRTTLIINLPGSPKGVTDALPFLGEVLPHAIEMIKGKGHQPETDEKKR